MWNETCKLMLVVRLLLQKVQEFFPLPCISRYKQLTLDDVSACSQIDLCF